MPESVAPRYLHSCLRQPMAWLALLIALVLLVWRLAIDTPNFARDDAYHLFLASELEWYRFLFQPDVYQRISTAHLTPFSVAYYALALRLTGFSVSGFLWLQLLLFGFCLWSFALLLRLRYRLSLSLLAMFVGLACSLGYLGTLLSRFYTEHYLLGGVFAAWALICLHRWQGSQAWRDLLPAAVLIWLAMLAKEVFLGLPLIAVLLTWRSPARRGSLLALALALWFAYFAYRGYMLGTWFGGREGGESLGPMLQQVLHALPDFGIYYLRSHAVLLLLLGLSFCLAPRQVLAGCLLAGTLLAPSLAAPHGFLQPGLHADRLFIAGDLVLAATVVVGFANGQIRWRAGMVAGIVVLLLAGAGWSIYLAKPYFRQVAASADFRITRSILQARPGPAAIYLPPEFSNGSLIAAYTRHAGLYVPVTANCVEALQWTMPGALYFDRQGRPIPREMLAQDCRSTQPEQVPTGEVHFSRGVLSWQLHGFSPGGVGVYFPAHALFIPAAVFRERLVRPAPDEVYQLYWQRDGNWWFSPPQRVRFE